MSVEQVNTWWQKGFKKEAARFSNKPASPKGSWVAPTQFQSLLSTRITRRKKG